MAKRTVNGVTFTKSPYTGAWENREHGLCVHACHTGNLCSKVAYYCIKAKDKPLATSHDGLAQALATAVQMTRPSGRPATGTLPA